MPIVCSLREAKRAAPHGTEYRLPQIRDNTDVARKTATYDTKIEKSRYIRHA